MSALAATPRTHAASETLPDADLLVLGQLAEFADSEDEHQELVTILAKRPWDFEWKLGQLRRRRERRAKQAEEAQRLTVQGYVLLDNVYDVPEGAAQLDELCTGEDETPLDPATHVDCPGRAAALDVEAGLTVRVTEFCSDYAVHGHHTIASIKVAASEAQLRADGVPIADPDAEGVAPLHELFADEQAEHTLTSEEHADCPGHAAYVKARHYWSTVEVQYVCTDYAAHGHILRAAVVSKRPEPDPAYKAAEIKRAGANNKLWVEAKADRRDWLIKFFTGWRKRKAADLPTRVHHWLALAPVLASDYLDEAAPAQRYACTLLKLPEPEGHQRDGNPLVVRLRKKATTDTQAVLIRLAEVIGACEEHWDKAYTANADSSWRRPSGSTRFYFELLASIGYPLSHVEQLINNPDIDNERWPHLAPDTESAEPNEDVEDVDDPDNTNGQDNTPTV